MIGRNDFILRNPMTRWQQWECKQRFKRLKSTLFCLFPAWEACCAHILMQEEHRPKLREYFASFCLVPSRRTCWSRTYLLNSLKLTTGCRQCGFDLISCHPAFSFWLLFCQCGVVQNLFLLIRVKRRNISAHIFMFPPENAPNIELPCQLSVVCCRRTGLDGGVQLPHRLADSKPSTTKAPPVPVTWLAWDTPGPSQLRGEEDGAGGGHCRRPQDSHWLLQWGPSSTPCPWGAQYIPTVLPYCNKTWLLTVTI